MSELPEEQPQTVVICRPCDAGVWVCTDCSDLVCVATVNKPKCPEGFTYIDKREKGFRKIRTKREE